MAEKNQKRKWKYKLPGEIKKQILKELLRGPKRISELIFKINLQKTTIGNHLRWLIKRGVVDYRSNRNIRFYFVKRKKKAKEFIKNPSKFIKSKKINNYGLSQLKVLEILNKENKRYSEIEKYFGFCSSATFKLISSLSKKGFIKKKKKRWFITNKGRKILSFNNQKARYLLYSNVRLA